MLRKIPPRQKHSVWMAFIITFVIALSKITSNESSSLFDMITMPPLIGLLGAAAGTLLVLLAYLVERLFAWLEFFFEGNSRP